MNASIPRYDLPDTWAGKGACPVCRVRGRLTVVHQSVTPDQMWCAACDAAFEVESGGAHLRLVRLPVTEPTATESMLEQWVLPSELPALLAGHTSTLVEAAPEAAPLIEVEAPATPLPEAPGAEAPAEPTRSTVLNLPPKSTLSDSIRDLLYGSDETGEPATGHAPPPDMPAPVASPAATLLANLRAEAPDAAAEPPATVEMNLAAPEMVEPAVLEPDSAALLAALLAALPAGPASVDEASFLDSLAAQAGAPGEAAPKVPLPAAAPPASVAVEPALAGDAAALLAQLLQQLPAAQTAVDESGFLDAPAVGETPAVTSAVTAPTATAKPPAETGLVTTTGQALAVPEIVIILPNPPDSAELAERAAQLYKLGNSLALIQAALERTGASADQVALAMREVRAQDQQRLARHAGSYRVFAGVGLVLVLLLIIAGAASALRPVSSGPAGPSATSGPTITPGGPTQTPTPAYNLIIALLNMLMPSDVKLVNGNTPTPGPTSEFFARLFPPTATPPPATATALAATAASVGATAAAVGTANHVEDGVPDWMKALVPEGIPIVGGPTPAVEAAGPPSADCPFTSELAAALFGGDGANWSYDADNNGWFMTIFATPITVRVPLNMSAGYLVVGETIEFRTVHGPATVTNVNFIAISCDL